MPQFSNKNHQESVYLGFDFTNRLDTAETIVSATFTIRCITGIDSLSSAMLSGNSVINGSMVKIRVQNGLAGSTYELSVVIVTSGSRTLYCKSDLVVS